MLNCELNVNYTLCLTYELIMNSNLILNYELIGQTFTSARCLITNTTDLLQSSVGHQFIGL